MGITQYVEQLNFMDSKAFEEFLVAMEKNPVAREAMRRYERDFGVTECTFTLSPNGRDRSACRHAPQRW